MTTSPGHDSAGPAPGARSRIPINTQMVVLGVTFALWGFLALRTTGTTAAGETYSRFLNSSNIQNVMRQMAIQGVIGIGAALVIITGGIDLSVGSLIAFMNVAMAILVSADPSKGGLGWSPLAAVAAILLLSSLVGLCNGAMVYELKLPPFIATLGMMGALRGAAQLVSAGRTIGKLPVALKEFAAGKLLGIPLLFLVLVVVLVVVETLLRRTTFGRYLYAIGSNREAARLSGVNTRMVTYGAYVLASLLGGIAGCMQTARDWQGNPTTGMGFELDAIAAAVLGGASLAGAEGSAVGAFIGALLMTTIYNGAVLLGIPSAWTIVTVSLILIVTVAADQLRKRREGG
ncbi:MAG: ABC transporter permease [Lentisphaeria bacterium]|nr:ABC transporter permease [Lentisphaeria bacterium]